MVVDSVMTAAAVVGALSVIFGGLYAIYRVARKVDDAIGADRNGRSISERLDRVEYQLWENGGNSLADRVNDLGDCVKETQVEVKVMKDVLLTMVAASEAAATKPRRKRADLRAIQDDK